ncbi:MULTISPECIES: hypothetical protein [unclassified Clostridium]|uniref:hemerythrin domain-containing protein n=1 Tax=unclassified Clostridium TaxID=2614128 RepID=UPI0002986499|nr:MULTISPECIES: hypothetical protein [unclassified Clostridium]EKQ56858.1 MAG: hypothetical protein A370_01634 [Clostridium sp. Maddingley MBC34-26]
MITDTRQNNDKEIEISPTEDLMREHGILHRVLLIYNDAIKYLRGQKINNQLNIYYIINRTACITHKFIEGYHQKLEEQYVFPRFLQNNRHIELINTLRIQHDAASRITENILHLSSIEKTFYFQNSIYLIQSLITYINMYEPHSAREDTVVFPIFHELISREEFDKLGDLFEEIEEQKFGKDGFTNIVNEVAQIENILGIYDLAQFTPIEASIIS